MMKVFKKAITKNKINSYISIQHKSLFSFFWNSQSPTKMKTEHKKLTRLIVKHKASTLLRFPLLSRDDRIRWGSIPLFLELWPLLVWVWVFYVLRLMFIWKVSFLRIFHLLLFLMKHKTHFTELHLLYFMQLISICPH